MQKIEPAMFEDLFEHRLRQYDEDKRDITSEAQKQETLSQQIHEANNSFVTAKKGDSSTREREQALQRLENAYLKFKEIQGNIKTGREFYNNLAKMVSRFRDQCKDFAYQRRIEAGHMESDLADAMSSLSLAQTSSLQDQKERESLRNQYGARAQQAPRGEPLAAPVPTRANIQPPPAEPPTPSARLWSPEMGINFGPAPQGPPQQQQQQQNGNVRNPAYPDTRGRPGQWDSGQGVRFG